MKQRGDIWWPDATSARQMEYARRSVQWLDWAIEHCKRRRRAVQAGGNIGLWPDRLARYFDFVLTFEPDNISRECLVKNVQKNVSVRPEALGSCYELCGIKHRSLGSHRVIDGEDVFVVPLDGMQLEAVDLIVFDLEGYELHALKGAQMTIQRHSPLIQVEVRGEEEKYGYTERDVHEFLGELGYKEVSRQPGPDAVFAK